MKNATWSNAARTAAINAKTTLLNSGYLKIYDSTGAGQPAGPDTAVTTQVCLATLRFGATAFPSGTNGAATANAITSDSNAANTGTPTWYRCLASDGTTAVHDGSIDTSNANMTLAAASIVAGSIVDCPTFVLTDEAVNSD